MRRKAFVTGGTRGIGAAIATALVEAGHEVVVSGTSAHPRRVPRRCRYRACDFSDPLALEVFAREVAGWRVSILVNNAGINTVGSLQGYDPAEFARIQQINVVAPFRLCQAVVPGMRKRRFGRIVNITSIFGVVSKAGRGAYSASKFALLGLSRALALEVAAENVLVNCLAPGFVDTDLTRGILGARGIARMRRLIPMGRLARPREIARAVRFLVSEENTYMTGQQVVVDGGFVSA